MSSEENKAIIRRFYEALNRGDPAIIDALVAPDFAYNGQVIGQEGVRQHFGATRAAFPDLAWTIEEMLADGDRVITRYTYSGTQHGELMGIPPTAKHFRSAGIAIDRIVGGTIVEEWEVRDTLGALRQLGALTAS
jgi:steroid delta-isomerase-like uncharacterized protein